MHRYKDKFKATDKNNKGVNETNEANKINGTSSLKQQQEKHNKIKKRYAYRKRSREMQTKSQLEVHNRKPLSEGRILQAIAPKYHLKSVTMSLIITNGIATDEHRSIHASATINLMERCIIFV